MLKKILHVAPDYVTFPISDDILGFRIPVSLVFQRTNEPMEPFRNFRAQDLLSITDDSAAKNVPVNRNVWKLS